MKKLIVLIAIAALVLVQSVGARENDWNIIEWEDGKCWKPTGERVKDGGLVVDEVLCPKPEKLKKPCPWDVKLATKIDSIRFMNDGWEWLDAIVVENRVLNKTFVDGRNLTRYFDPGVYIFLRKRICKGDKL